MTLYCIKGGTSDAKSRAIGYIRNRLPVRPPIYNDKGCSYEEQHVSPCFIWLSCADRLVTNGPVSELVDPEAMVLSIGAGLTRVDVGRILHDVVAAVKE